MFIQTETTPNPATLKFLPGRTVLPEGTLDLPNREVAAKSPLAERLFEIAGVTGVFFGSDFITVTKSDAEWQQLKPAILGAIMEHFMSGGPLLRGEATGGTEAEEFFEQADAETVATIKDLIETRVRPAVANDGGDITFRGYQGRRCLPRHAGFVLGLPVIDGDPQARHSELVAPLRARGRRSTSDVTLKSCGFAGVRLRVPQR